MKNQQSEQPNALQTAISDGTSEDVRRRYGALVEAARQSDFGELDSNIVILDTETTGFSLSHDELTQIAAARMEKGEITDWFITFVNPGKPIPEEVAHLTNIHDADVCNAPSPADALTQLVAFVGDAKIVAHNAEFDRNFTTKHPSGYPLLENVWIDSLDLARIALPRMRSHRLLDLIKAFGGPLSTHRADADVEATCVLFRILLAAVDAMPQILVSRIASLATVQEWPTSVVFNYFATKKAPSDSADGDDKKERFSLRALRAQRVSSTKLSAKIDAESIAADSARELVFPAQDDIAGAFGFGGLVGRLYKDFEPRTEQRLMAEAVQAAFAASENLMAEAGTGVGKSMAYLVPSALTARKNNITVGIATKTNALLDQLIYRELPSLAAALKTEDASFELTYASLKGYTHYPCLRRVDRLVQEGVGFREVAGKQYSQAPALAALLSFVEQTEYDDIDGLKIDYRVLPRRFITTTSHECLRRKCPYYGTLCFVHGARRRAESVDIVVTNHSLLFCDLAAEGGLLPPIRYWVIDEAHGAEVEARRAFSLELSAEELLQLAHRVSADEASRNVFIQAERRVVVDDSEKETTLFYALISRARAAGNAYAQAANDFTHHIKDLLFFDANKQGKSYETVELWINDDVRASETFKSLVAFGDILSETAEKLVSACQELVGYLENRDGVAELQREIASIALDLKEVLRACEVVLKQASECYVYSATLCKKREKAVDKLEALLLHVGDALHERLYANTHSVVYTSATLTIDKSFTVFEEALGLNTDDCSQSRFCQLDSSYDFDAHMTIYVVDDMPEPNDAHYLSALQQLLVDAHKAQQGSMLTLFTNKREMEKCFDVVQPALKSDDLRLVCQKWGVSVKGLRDDFLADEHLSLFALKSFWEGFDAPGATLKGVIIPKLPFAKPTDPLSCERAVRDSQAWRRYVLPAAILETRQAAGRLIRKADDSGVLILADRRLLTKSYGKTFLNSLPSRTIKICSAADIVADLERSS